MWLQGCSTSPALLAIPYPAMALNQTGVNIEALMYNTMKVAEGYSPEPLLGWVAEVAKGAPNGRLAALVIRCHGGPGILYIGARFDRERARYLGGIKPEQASAFEKVKGLVEDIFLVGCNVVGEQNTGRRLLSGDDLCSAIANHSRARVFASAAKQPDFTDWPDAPFQYIYEYALPAFVFKPDQPRAGWNGRLPVA